MKQERFTTERKEKQNTAEAAYQADLRQTAWHEGARAVMHVLCGIQFTAVEVFTDEHPGPTDVGCSGVVGYNYITEWPYESDQERHADDLIRIWHAGPIAESMYAGCKPPACVSKNARANVRGICRGMLRMTPSATKERAARLELATRVILQHPAIWGAVTAVAKALLRQNVLTWDEVWAVMHDSGPQDPGSGQRGSGQRGSGAGNAEGRTARSAAFLAESPRKGW
jgi:hypothetical protein